MNEPETSDELEDYFRFRELEWQEYATDPATAPDHEQRPSRLATVLLWLTCLIVCLGCWAAAIRIGAWAILSIVHWLQGLIP